MSDLTNEIIKFWGYKSEYLEREEILKIYKFSDGDAKTQKLELLYIHTHTHIYPYTQIMYVYYIINRSTHFYNSSLCIFDLLFL